MTRASKVPIDADDLRDTVQFEIRLFGVACDLNHIDVSDITDFSYLFDRSQFVGDISRWDVGKGQIFDNMFHACPFNGDISRWNMSSAVSLLEMFQNSAFTGDISRWDVSSARQVRAMFLNASFDGDLSAWRLPFARGDVPLSSIVDLVAHHERGSRKNLRLPELPVEGYRLFLSRSTMHSWLDAQRAQGNVTRYHWDALLRDPGADWASPEMAQHAQTYLSLGLDLEDSFTQHSALVMRAWNHTLDPQEEFLALPDLSDTP